MAASPAEILREQNPDAIPAEAPPPAANYREADVEGIACQFCSKFVFTGEANDEVASGYCGLWEANVKGDHVSDGFADPGPPLNEDGVEDWEFADKDRAFAEIFLSAAEAKEDPGDSKFVVKEILRTGEWPVIPTGAGVIPKPLKIVRDGKSDKNEGVIALSEVVENFKAGAIPNPQIPLSDDRNDHKNITRLNTGFIRDLWITDGDGGSRLVAKMEFTEPDVHDRVLRGTYADVSCGIPWNIRSRGKDFGACLEHVCITNKPFIDGLGPFFAASDIDQSEVEVTHFGDQVWASEESQESPPEEESQEEAPPEEDKGSEGDPPPASSENLSAQQMTDQASEALVGQLGLSADYEVVDITSEGFHVHNRIAEMTWNVPFAVKAESVSLAQVADWTEVEGATEPPANDGRTPCSSLDELEQARLVRGLLASATTTREKEANMALTREELDRLELSEEARAAILPVLNENAELRKQTREDSANQRVNELEELGLKDRPGALKLYRQVMLSDDGGPAIVLLSDEGQEKERLTTLQVLDRFIDAVKGEDGKLQLSQQHLASGNDDPPPANTEDEKTLDERKRNAKEALYGPDKK